MQRRAPPPPAAVFLSLTLCAISCTSLEGLSSGTAAAPSDDGGAPSDDGGAPDVPCVDSTSSPDHCGPCGDGCSGYTPVTSRVAAYAWANQETTASYAPNPSYSYNSAGGAITAARSSVGAYTMTFVKLSLTSGDVQVTAYGSDRHCNVGTRSGSSATVLCYDASGNPADSKFTVSVLLNNIVTAANAVAYAWANDPTSASYTPNAANAYNASGGAITATRTAAGTYKMTFANLTLSSGVVQVSSYGSANYCAINNWNNNDVLVRCSNPAGALADSAYTVSVVMNDVRSDAKTSAYAWADAPASTSYTPTAAYAYNAAGGAITATRSATGVYAIKFAGLSLAKGNVKVSAQGSANRCHVMSWSGDSINVGCSTPAGAAVNSAYTVQVTQ